MRPRTTWFKQDARRPPEALASVIAATLWKLTDRVVDNLSRAGFAMEGPERALKIIAELLAFGLHACDRVAHARLADAERAALVQAIGTHLARVLEQNGLDAAHRDDFITLLNCRGADYASFEFPEGSASYAALRYAALQIREAVAAEDQAWVMDQAMDVELPALLEPLRRTVARLLPA